MRSNGAVTASAGGDGDMRRLLTMVLWSVLAAGCSGAGAPGSGAAEAEAAAAGATGDTAVSAGTAAGNGTTAAGIPREITPAIAQGPLPLGVSRLQPATIMDASGFEKPVVAASVLVPVGWRAQGGYVWNVGNPCAAGDYQLNWSVSAPDGISAVAFVVKPKWLIVKFFMQFDRGPPSPCEGPDWTTTRQYLEGLARQSSPQVRLLDYQERPDLAREQQAAIDAIDRMIPQSPTDLMQSRTRAEAGQILFAHTVNGREVREMIVAVMMFTESAPRTCSTRARSRWSRSTASRFP
jgi:hypothetical protein